MKNLTGLILIAALAAGCSSTKSSGDTNGGMAANTADKGFTPLFDGKTTAGWHTYGKQTAGSAWKVQDGTLMLDASSKENRGDLVTNEEYQDFHLKLDWKIAPKGNSGVIFLVHEDAAKYKQTYNTGLEMQVLDNDGHPDAKIIKHRAGDLYDLISVNKETVKPAGEWNHAEVVVKNGKLDLYLNGQHGISTTLWNDEWKNMVANSKFKSMPEWGSFKQGKIALQDHGDVVWYKNIQIKRL